MKPYWLADTETLVRFLAITAGLLLSATVIMWLVYRWFVSRLNKTDILALRKELKAIRSTPEKIVDKRYWVEQIAPRVAMVAPVVSAWILFVSALGFITLVLTNILLLATLLVQTLSAERLGLHPL